MGKVKSPVGAIWKDVSKNHANGGIGRPKRCPQITLIVADKDRKPFASDLKTIYHAATEEKAFFESRVSIELEENQSFFLPEGERIRGHEFHYFDSKDNGSDCLAIKPVTGRSYPCVMVGENYWIGFPHLYYPSNPSFVKRFIEKAEAYKEGREKSYG